MGEDLLAARMELGISPRVAAERAELDPGVYCALEAGRVEGNSDGVDLVLSTAKRLGLAEVRFSYIDEVHQSMKVDLATDAPTTVFVDSLSVGVAELKSQAVFVSPHRAMSLVDRIGAQETLASRRPVDKQLIELFAAAIYTLSLDRRRDHYVRLVRDDPPDAEVLELDGADGRMRRVAVEVSRYGEYSRSLVEVIGKKLQKSYEKGTVLVALVEQAERIQLGELHDFVRSNNRHDLRVVVVGRSATAERLKVLSLEEVVEPTSGQVALLEIDVAVERASKGHRGYQGVVLRPTLSRSLPEYPVFVKNLELDRGSEREQPRASTDRGASP